MQPLPPALRAPLTARPLDQDAFLDAANDAVEAAHNGLNQRTVSEHQTRDETEEAAGAASTGGAQAQGASAPSSITGSDDLDASGLIAYLNKIHGGVATPAAQEACSCDGEDNEIESTVDVDDRQDDSALERSAAQAQALLDLIGTASNKPDTLYALLAA